MNRMPLLPLLGLLLIVNAGFAANVSNCTTISAPGVYYLNQSLTGANQGSMPYMGLGNVCIKIISSDVLFDCDGYTLTGTSDPTNAIMVTASSTDQRITNVTVRNCQISDYSRGIVMGAVNGSTIQNNTIYSNTYYGIESWGESGRVDFLGNNVSSNYDGMVFYGALGSLAGHRLIGNSVDNNNRWGINLESVGNVTMINNTAMENGAWDLWLNSNWPEMCVYDVQNLTGSGGRQIMVADSQVSWSDLEVAAMFLCNADGSVLDNITIHGSDSLQNNGMRILHDNGSTLTNLASSDNQLGLEMSYDSGTRVEGCVLDRNALSGFIGTTSVLYGNTLTLCSAEENGQYGFNINSNGDFGIYDSFAGGNAISGFLLTGPSFEVRRSSARRNAADGFTLYCSDSFILDSNASENAQNGFFASGSDNNTLAGNIAEENRQDGFNIEKSSNGNTLLGNIAAENAVSGFEVSSNKGSSDNNTLIDNVAERNQYGFYFFGAGGTPAGTSRYHLVENNTARNNEELGMFVGSTYAQGSRFIGNVLSGNGDAGMYLVGTANHLVRGNTFDNEYTGIYSEVCSNITIEDNYIADSGNDGIYAFSTTNSQILRNRILNTVRDSAIWLDYYSNDNLIANNTLANGVYGIAVYANSGEVSYNTISGNNVSGFTYGIDFYNGNYNNASDNDVWGNNYGLIFNPGSYNTFERDRIHGNDFGIFIDSGDGNTFMHEIIHSNPNAGYYLDAGAAFENAIRFSHFYNNGWAAIAANSVSECSPSVFQMDYCKFGTDSINISIYDEVSCEGGYKINETLLFETPPENLTSFESKFFKIQYNDERDIDTLIVHWTNAESADYEEDTLGIYTWDGAAWGLTPDQALDIDLNTISVLDLVNINAEDTYGVFARYDPGDEGAGGGDGGEESLRFTFESSCDGNIVTAYSGSAPEPGVRVLLDGLFSGYTDGSGQYLFEGCGRGVEIGVSKAGFENPNAQTFSLIDCSSCPIPCESDADCLANESCAGGICTERPGCTSDSQCPAGSECENGVCVEREGCSSDSDCPAGQACEAGSCVLRPGCTSDSQCAAGSVCQDGSCVERPSPACASDSDCAESERCSGGACVAVEGCGQIINHALVPYECGSEPGCPSCPQGEYCENHACASYSIICPESAEVGATADCSFLREGAPCRACNGTVRGPDDASSPFVTDDDGRASFLLKNAGNYSVRLLSGGAAVQTRAILAAMPMQAPEGEGPLAMLCSLPSMIVLALIVLAVAYLALRAKGKKGAK